MTSLNIALDYDGTYTAAPFFWQRFIELAGWEEHKVYIVTMRDKELDHISAPPFDVSDVIYCNGRSKREVCAERGIRIDIWIDDMPEGISWGSAFTPEQLIEWRKVRV